MTRTSHITDEVVEFWQQMPLIITYDPRNGMFLGIKNYHVNEEEPPLSERLAVEKSMIERITNEHGQAKGLRMVREKMHQMINKRIEEKYKGKNVEIQ